MLKVKLSENVCKAASKFVGHVSVYFSPLLTNPSFKKAGDPLESESYEKNPSSMLILDSDKFPIEPIDVTSEKNLAQIYDCINYARSWLSSASLPLDGLPDPQCEDEIFEIGLHNCFLQDKDIGK